MYNKKNKKLKYDGYNFTLNVTDEPFKICSLPWHPKSLAPYISIRTVYYHYTKHHVGYVNKLNGLVRGTTYASQELLDLIKQTKTQNTSIFRPAAQTYNHCFYWSSLKPNSTIPLNDCSISGNHTGNSTLIQALKETYGSCDAFITHFKETASGNFGSGWIWLVVDHTGSYADSKLRLIITHDADTPIATDNIYPLFVADLWEHAYYLDYPAQPLDYITNFLNHLVNWQFAEENYQKFRTINAFLP